ncbi:MAG: permease, partial [Chloroflexota bacterium]
LAGMAQVVLPAELISRWMGNESGLTGVLIGTLVGSIVPGGPYVVVPIIGSVYNTGAGPGAIAAFVSAWSLSPITRTVMFEVPFLGGALTAARLIVSTPASIAIGMLTIPIYNLLFG